LHKKISIENGKVKVEEEESWLDNILNKVGIKDDKKQEGKEEHTLRTKSTKR
jgi:hypothetical protein